MQLYNNYMKNDIVCLLIYLFIYSIYIAHYSQINML